MNKEEIAALKGNIQNALNSQFKNVKVTQFRGGEFKFVADGERGVAKLDKEKTTVSWEVGSSNGNFALDFDQPVKINKATAKKASAKTPEKKSKSTTQKKIVKQKDNVLPFGVKNFDLTEEVVQASKTIPITKQRKNVVVIVDSKSLAVRCEPFTKDFANMNPGIKIMHIQRIQKSMKRGEVIVNLNEIFKKSK